MLHFLAGDTSLPLYEYQCEECGRFELIQKFSDSPLTACPKCGREVQKLLSAPAIQFKGTGWYITDYARKGSGESGAKSAEGGSGKKAEGGAAKDGSSSASTDTGTSKEGSAARSGTGK